MRIGIYVMKDEKVGFLNPMADTNDGTAIRNFKHAIENNAIMHCNPKDFSLYKIGSFDSSDGETILESTLTLLCHGTDFGGDLNE